MVDPVVFRPRLEIGKIVARSFKLALGNAAFLVPIAVAFEVLRQALDWLLQGKNPLIYSPRADVPAPIKATDLTSRLVTFLSRFGTLAALRSAKNTCCSAFDWLFCAHFRNNSRSRAIPLSKGRVAAASRASSPIQRRRCATRMFRWNPCCSAFVRRVATFQSC